MHRAVTHHTSPARPRPVRSLLALGALLTVVLSVVLAGCSSGDSSTSGQAVGAAAQDSRSSVSSGPGNSGTPGAKRVPGANQVPEVDSTAGAKPPAGAAASGGVSRSSGAPAVSVGPKLTRNASLEVQVKDVPAAAARVRTIAAGVQAQVVSEQIGGGNGGPTPLQNGKVPSTATPERSSSDPSSSDPRPPRVIGGSSDFGTLTLSVPSEKLDTALDQLGRVGTVLQRSASSADVTAQYVDTQSRLKTMRSSVERVRALMSQAKDLGQVVALESELSQREADLESLESQLAALTTSVERSTLTVSLSTPGAETVESNGFLAGLSAGWDAFLSSAGGLLKGIGAALPFALFFALLAAPLVAWLRRRRTLPAAAVNS